MHAFADAVLKNLSAAGGPALLPFHRAWIRSAFAPDVAVAALSCPRGNAKTQLAARLAALSITPGSPLWESGVEVLGVSASLEQSRVLLAFVREALGAAAGDDYRWLDSGQRLAVTHKATGTKLRILSSSARRAMGIAKFSTIFADEPGSWEQRGGRLMYDALRQSLGKRESQRLVLIGTRAPAEPGSWWPELLEAGSGPGRHVTVLAAPPGEAWDSWPTIRRANPMVNASPVLRLTVLRERDEARRSDTLRRSFEAFRLNRMVDVSNEVLCEADAWVRVEGRDVAPRVGRPIVGLDLGAERSWSAAWVLWPNGRSEVYALCPGVPDLAERERADAQPRGLYRRLADDGVLLVDEGRRVSRPSVLLDHLTRRGIVPAVVYCDRFMLGTLTDAVAGRWPVVPRATRWSESTEDIAAFRRLVADGPLSVVPEGRALARVGLSEASVQSDDQGSVRLVKRRASRSRDDVAVAATLAAGALVRVLGRQPQRRRRRTALVG